MIVEYVRYELPEELAGDFADAYRGAGAILSGDRHCLTWEVRRGVEQPSRHVVRITWDSQEGHEKQFRSTPAYENFLARPSVLPRMIEAGGGSIINVSPVGALVALPRLTAYRASKAAVLGRTRSLAYEYASW